MARFAPEARRAKQEHRRNEFRQDMLKESEMRSCGCAPVASRAQATSWTSGPGGCSQPDKWEAIEVARFNPSGRAMRALSPHLKHGKPGTRLAHKPREMRS